MYCILDNHSIIFQILCNVVNIGETQLSKLQKVQNWAIKVILQCDIYICQSRAYTASATVYVRKIEAVL